MLLNEVVCEKRSYTKEYMSHQHAYGQFLFPLQGSLDIETDHQHVHLTPDYCFYLPPGFNHDYRSDDRNEFLILDIPVLYLPDRTDTMYTRLDEQWSAIRYLLLEEAGQQKAESLSHLTRYVSGKLQLQRPASVEYLHSHFREPVRLETLAAMEHYHPAYYSAWFKKQTGKTVKAYVSDLRLKEAQSLLKESSWTIGKISEETGFENASSFTRWFAGQTGFTPKQYRQLKNG
ncbi:AraC family transcriptional regulator [Jeotgalibacillus sp. R-1-5s-1]|uniref:helix-turn-helix transcriptional regulator n=1 Tax=Jeotgalibacillus sp. R-1-5s-1 TaxID=2555897 RepID=UPI002110B90A|nr:AraC family transcriptional regulator [Jeotgalibacillus sp. R-1-5s-1]